MHVRFLWGPERVMAQRCLQAPFPSGGGLRDMQAGVSSPLCTHLSVLMSVHCAGIRSGGDDRDTRGCTLQLHVFILCACYMCVHCVCMFITCAYSSHVCP